MTSEREQLYTDLSQKWQKLVEESLPPKALSPHE